MLEILGELSPGYPSPGLQPLIASPGCGCVRRASESRRAGQVTQSSHDIGVRIALGAGSGNISSLVVRQGMTLAAAGVVAGLADALLLTRAMPALLFGVGEHDLARFAAVPAFLLGAAFLESYLPGAPATGVDPLLVLRDE